MKDLLKEAIADAKAVRETALQNAKIALEEAFTPRLQSIISSQLQKEEEGADDEMQDEDDVDSTEEAPVEDAPVEDEVATDDESSEEYSEDETGEGEAQEEEDVDLEEIIRELEGSDDENVDDLEELDSSAVGSAPNKAPSKDASDSSEDGEDIDLFEDDMEGTEDVADDEEVDLDEVIRSLREEDEVAPEEDTKEEELEEAYNVIRFLKDKINEVNLLNAKLLYSNKLFKSYDLNEGQKMKVIENFDRAHSMREVKLVYTTLAESFRGPAGSKRIVKESFASKPVASTKPNSKNVLTEGATQALRFQKLAGLIK